MKSFNKILLALSLVGMLVTATVGLAEDIDIYKSSGAEASNPNILVVIDNSANWDAANQHWPGGIKQGQAELDALRTVIGELGSTVNVGLMMFTPGSTANNPNGPGGYVRFKVRQMDSTRKAAFQEMLGNPSSCTNGLNSYNNTPNCIYQNFASPSEKVGTSKTDYSAALYEVFKYFGGYTCPAHANDDVARCSTGVDDASHFGLTRYSGAPEANADYKAYTQTLSGTVGANATGSWDIPRTDLNYRSPLNSGNGCAKNFVIFIGNGFPVQDSPSTLLTGVGGDATPLPVPDFAVTPTVTQTLLSTTALGTYANTAAGKAACEAAAATTYGAAYASYTCSIASSSSSTATTALAATACGAYADAAACTTAETTANAATYDSVTCALSGVACAAGTTALGDTACGLGGTAGTYASAAACTTAETAANLAAYPGGVTCTQKAGNCSYTTSTGTQTSSCRADLASCNANAATDYAGPPWTSRSCGAVVTANCTYVQTGVTQNVNAANCIGSAALCTAAAPGLGFIAGSFSVNWADSCVPNVGGSKKCVITGSKNVTTGNTYTITGTATSASGLSFSRVGSGAPTYSFSRSGSKTTTTYSYNIYGNATVNAIVATGTSTGTSANYADEWAKFLNKTDVSSATGQQNIITYTIDVFKDAQSVDQTKLLMSMATNGGGKYFSATDEDAIKNALRKIFSEIQSVNSVFASSSLPVSVNTQGTYLNQVFMGMFRPDGGAKPRWAGNLKQYKFKVFNGVMRLADKHGDEAISSTTGFVSPCADSMWTTDSGQYWNYSGSNSKGGCSAETSAYPVAGSTSIWSDAPDGDTVEKGGAAQRLRGVSGATQSSTNYLTRVLKTCDGSSATSCTTLTNFATSNTAIEGAAGAVPFNVTAAEVDPLIDWVRGHDILNENNNSSGGVAITAEMRPSVHGGVVHSQPAVVDYGGVTGVISYYGADDGALHAVDGGTTDAEGTELWSFIAPETFGHLNRLKDNGSSTNLIPYPADPFGSASAGAGVRKDYFFDGGIGVYQSGATVWIYPSMRRGGRAVYAFDVTDPSSPAIKWRKGCFTNLTTDDASCSTGWSGIGQTWSKPTLAYLSGYTSGGVPKPVLVFGGGYDQCEDRNLITSSGCGTKGAQVWFVDADTGAIIRTYPTHASVPGDLSVVTDISGNLTYVYAADTKGYVYRVKVGSFNGTSLTASSSDASFIAAGWSSTTSTTASGVTTYATDIAYLSETNNPRKFLSGPNVVPTATYNAVLVGSGDREHPLIDSYACGSFSSTAGNFVKNQFFMLMDQPNDSSAVATAGWSSTTGGDYSVVLPSDAATNIGLVNVTSGVSTIALAGTTTTLTNVTSGVTKTSTRGWRFDYDTQCEQSVNKPLTIGGVTYFGTNAPSAPTSACVVNIGIARGYAVDFLTGAPVGTNRSAEFLGGGMPPSPVAGVVDVDGVKLPFIIGGVDTTAANQSALQGTKVTINPSGPRSRVFWYIRSD